MKDTSFSVPKEKQPRLAEMYRSDGKGGLRPANKLASYRFVSDTGYYSGGVGLCSTMRDYLRFCQMLVDGGRFGDKRLLHEETVQKMFKNQLPAGAGGRGFQFGLGFRISPQGDVSWGGAAGTRFWVDPKRKMAGIFMIQINPYRAANYGDQFKKTVYNGSATSK